MTKLYKITLSLLLIFGMLSQSFLTLITNAANSPISSSQYTTTDRQVQIDGILYDNYITTTSVNGVASGTNFYTKNGAVITDKALLQKIFATHSARNGTDYVRNILITKNNETNALLGEIEGLGNVIISKTFANSFKNFSMFVTKLYLGEIDFLQLAKTDIEKEMLTYLLCLAIVLNEVDNLTENYYNKVHQNVSKWSDNTITYNWACELNNGMNECFKSLAIIETICNGIADTYSKEAGYNGVTLHSVFSHLQDAYIDEAEDLGVQLLSDNIITFVSDLMTAKDNVNDIVNGTLIALGALDAANTAKNTFSLINGNYMFRPDGVSRGVTFEEFYSWQCKLAGESSTTTPPSSGSTSFSYSTGTYKIIAKSGLNFRSLPGLNGTVYSAIVCGTIVDILEVSSNWGKIVYNGTSGWICLGVVGEPYVEKISSIVPSTGSENMTASELKTKISSVYSSARNYRGKSFQGYCGAYVNHMLYWNGITKSLGETAGNGCDQYEYYANKSTTSGGYTITAYPWERYSMKNFLNAISSQGTKNVYNILLGWDYGNNKNKFGHVVFIYGIVDGYVYWSESFPGGSVASNGFSFSEGQPIVATINQFANYYNAWVSEYDGAIHFTENSDLSNDGNTTPPISTVNGFSVIDAANYAKTYWQNYNSAQYGDYGPYGGDCCNFVSQALYAGGLPMTDSWYYYGFGNSNNSPSWRAVTYLRSYLVGQLGCNFISSPASTNVSIGDILVYGDNDHAAICTDVIDGVPYVCAHTRDVYTSNWTLGYSTYGVIKTSTLSAPSTEYATLELGTYYIKSMDGSYLSPTKVSTDSDDTQISTASSPTSAMRFQAFNQNGGYSFKSFFNGNDNRLNAWTKSSSAGNHVTIYPHSGHATQTWRLIAEGATYYIVPLDNSSLAITLINGKTSLQPLVLGSSNQRFFFEHLVGEHNITYVKSTEGAHIASCECGYEKKQTCSYNSGVVTTKCTNTADGIITYTCTLCKDEKHVPIVCEHKNHTTDGKCTGDNCIAILEHTYTGTVTCTQSQSCTVCGHSLDAKGHTAGAAATCTTAQTCTTCKAVITAKLGHSMQTIAAKASTCKTQGNNAYYKCTRCNLYFKDANGTTSTTVSAQKLPLAACKWNSGVITTQPTETSTGIKTYTCTVCGKTKTETIPKLPASPANAPTLVVESVSGRKGDTVTVNVLIKNNPGFGGMAYDLKFDDSVLELTNCTLNLGANICTNSGVGTYSNKINFQYAGTANVTGDGVLATLTFKIKDSAVKGNYSITAVPEIGTSFTYSGRSEVDFTLYTSNGNVNVTEYIAGDINGDGTVTNRDAVRIMQMLAGWDVDYIEAALDVDGNGKINNRDATRLMQYCAGWDVQIY